MIQNQPTGPAGSGGTSRDSEPRGGDPRLEGCRQAWLLDEDDGPAAGREQGALPSRGCHIDADHLVRGALLACDSGQGARQPLGAVPAQDQARDVMGPGHHPLIRGGEEPVEGVVGAGVDIVAHLAHLALTDPALTDLHEAPR